MKSKIKFIIGISILSMPLISHANWIKAGANENVIVLADDRSLIKNQTDNWELRTLFDFRHPIKKLMDSAQLSQQTFM